MATTARGDQVSQRQLKEYRLGNNRLAIGNYIGLAMKAGMVAAGDLAAKKSLTGGKVYLLVLAKDTSSTVIQQLTQMALQKSLPLLWWPDKNSLGQIVGKSLRGALAILDKGLSDAIINICE
ncbi:MAG: ribosomal L7Ae/L30e/S12e/Gadd45 family protein [Clostridiales bacterium]|nr:ribosomal L7Ae/L30e/S12e/Gadd45 family protein [Clostridiales bacterium]